MAVHCESVLGRGGDARSSGQSCEKLTSVIHLVRAELHLMEVSTGTENCRASRNRKVQISVCVRAGVAGETGTGGHESSVGRARRRGLSEIAAARSRSR